MGIEVLVVWVVLASAGAFGVNKTVDLLKHADTVEADKYNSCISATKDARQCRGLE